MAGISKAERERRRLEREIVTSAPAAWRKRSRKSKPAADRLDPPEMIEMGARIAELEQRCAQYQSLVETDAKTMAMLGGRLAEQDELTGMLGAQRDWLIGFANRLLDRFVGVQLLHGLTTIDAAVAFTNAEKQTAEAELQAIKARHEPTAEDAIMPELRERFTDAKQGIGEESYQAANG